LVFRIARIFVAAVLLLVGLTGLLASLMSQMPGAAGKA
jgi:predicted benzoate:H+ symporter BenE